MEEVFTIDIFKKLKEKKIYFNWISLFFSKSKKNTYK